MINMLDWNILQQKIYLKEDIFNMFKDGFWPDFPIFNRQIINIVKIILSAICNVSLFELLLVQAT